MNILLIDTSTRTARVGLIQNENLVDCREWENTPELGKKLLEEIESLLPKWNVEWKNVGRVAVHWGKEGSSFMALRAGIVTATMLAHASGAELVPVAGDSLSDIVKESCQEQGVLTVEPFYSTKKNAKIS